MIKIIPVVLSAGILVLQWKLFASAFSTTASTVGVKTSWPSTLSSRVLVTIYANTRGDVISADEERSVDASDVEDKAAVIFLHGLGDSPDGWASLADALPDLRPSLADLNITYVFPPANTVAITVNGGEKMPGWFDVFDWPIGVDAKDDPKGLAMSVKRVEKIVTQLSEEEGIDPSRIILGGFSQGGAVALMASYNRRKKDAIPFAGCICMSGWLPLKDYLDVSEESAKATPLFWAHGQYDDKILFEQQMYGVNKLESEGVDVIACSYPVGHESSNNEEIDDMAGFIESVLCPQSQKEKELKFAQVETDASDMEEEEMSALLYYLFALGMEGDTADGYVPSATSNMIQ